MDLNFIDTLQAIGTTGILVTLAVPSLKNKIWGNSSKEFKEYVDVTVVPKLTSIDNHLEKLNSKVYNNDKRLTVLETKDQYKI